MPPRNNPYVQLWLAAYCGDEQTLFTRAVGQIASHSETADSNGWPLIDTYAEQTRLVDRHSFARIDNEQPEPNTANTQFAIATSSVRAIVEPVSSFEFSLRGYLIDLALENDFAFRVLEYQRIFGGEVSDETPTNIGQVRSTDNQRTDVLTYATPSYAGTATVPAETFIGEIAFSDFACFEMVGLLTNLQLSDWSERFRRDLQILVTLVSPQR